MFSFSVVLLVCPKQRKGTKYQILNTLPNFIWAARATECTWLHPTSYRMYLGNQYWYSYHKYQFSESWWDPFGPSHTHIRKSCYSLLRRCLKTYVCPKIAAACVIWQSGNVCLVQIPTTKLAKSKRSSRISIPFRFWDKVGNGTANHTHKYSKMARRAQHADLRCSLLLGRKLALRGTYMPT